jgi:hypothetical protein
VSRRESAASWSGFRSTRRSMISTGPDRRSQASPLSKCGEAIFREEPNKEILVVRRDLQQDVHIGEPSDGALPNIGILVLQRNPRKENLVRQSPPGGERPPLSPP